MLSTAANAYQWKIVVPAPTTLLISPKARVQKKMCKFWDMWQNMGGRGQRNPN